MSLNRKTYSPMSHTYSYSSTLSPSYSGTLSPSYSYSRVTTYLDALQRDQAITKLKRQLNSVKSVQMKYHSLLQQISIAQKQNRLLQTKNNQIQREYIQKIQKTKSQVSQLESQLNLITQRLCSEQKNVDQAERQVQMMLQELKKLKMQQEEVQIQNKELQKQVSKCNLMFQQLTKHKQQLISKRSCLHQDSKTTSSQMQKNLKTLTELTAMIQKYEQQLLMLQKQSQRYSFQCQNIQGIFNKNNALLQSLQRKVKIQDGQNQQMKNELNQMIQNYQKMQKKSIHDKQSLYQNIIKVEQKSMLLKDILSQLDRTLQSDSTQKKYLKDISTKHGKLSGQNQTLRQMLKLLQSTYNDKKAHQTQLIQEINKKIKTDQSVKQGIELRNKELIKLKQKIMNC